MAKKSARAGGKFGGDHTTVIPAAGIIADIAGSCRVVTKISVGFIKAGLPNAKGKRRVKIAVEEGGILLTVRDNTSQQELRVYVSRKGRVSRDVSEVGK
jgi:hypothetical protein